VTCTNAAIDGGANDGFQLRDLRQLNVNNNYFPYLSIPYVGRKDVNTPIEFTTKVPGWSALLPNTNADLDNHWIHYWSREYAANVGRAKAILHLCYGLQCLTPNCQNFLLEYTNKMESTGKVVLRDVLDMKLHTDWVRTLLGGEANSSLKTFLGVNVEHMDHRLYELLKFEARTPSPKLTRGKKNPERTLIQDTETFENLMDPTGKT
jgi:hypothetical protein